MYRIIQPTFAPESENHIDIEDMARLADGTVDKAERQHLIHHLNRCQRCYEILQKTLKEVSADNLLPTAFSSRWKSKTAYAIIAFMLLILIIGGRLVIKFRDEHPPIILTTLDLDQQLKDILLENNALKWEKAERINRLVAALQQKGLQVKKLDLVVLSKPYYQKKSLFGPKEVLHIRVENNVAYLQVKQLDQGQ